MKIIKLFLRASLTLGFLSAVADRFGYWPEDLSVWGNWENFLEYTQLINPMLPESLIAAIGGLATLAEILFAILLLVGFKTELVAKLSGFLLLAFALAMASSIGIKSVFDYSVLPAAAAAFALSTMKGKYLELDLLLGKIST